MVASADAAGRLIQEDRTGSASTVWTYDDAGNRTAQSTGTNTTTYSYDADNRLLSQTNGSVVTSFTYDANGSMTGRSSPGETLAYAWDTAGRLSSITRNGTTQASFTYDGDGNRRTKTSGATTTTYVNDARGLSQVLQAITGTKTISYVGAAQYDSSRPTETEKWGYTLSDAQNSRLLLDNAGALSHRWEWEPFGRARADTGATPAAFTFGGEERDDETGLINLRARYYDPGIGRFLSRDSLPGSISLPQSWNRFSYVENDPINALDPSGHKKRTKIKWPNGQDPDDDADQAAKKAKKCKNPGQYTGSCKGGPPNAAYAADGEAQYEAKKAGQAAAAGYLAAAQAHLSSAQYFASVAGTAAALTAALQAQASIDAAIEAMASARSVDNLGLQVGNSGAVSLDSVSICAGNPLVRFTCETLLHIGVHLVADVLLHEQDYPQPPPEGLVLDRDGLPIYFLDAARMPNIAQNAYEAQLANPNWAVLTYNGPNSPLTVQNRREACGKFADKAIGTCEEYPFASTAEGGVESKTRAVPYIEQNIQGGDLNNFYTYKAKLKAGDRFRVVVWFGEGHQPP